MSQNSATVENISQAYEIIKEMHGEDVQWSGEYRSAARDALKKILEGRMRSSIDEYLEGLGEQERGDDRRNGGYSRHLLTELGDIELHVPRTRRFSAVKVVRAYARRAQHIDRMILACFVLGVSTRKVSEVLLPVLGERISASTVSRVAKQLDVVVKAFHRRRLQDRYKVLLFDGVVLSRKTGAGALRRPVLVALGILPDGRKEIIDFRFSRAESAAQWEVMFRDLYDRGLKAEPTQLVVVDGGSGLLAALPMVYHHLPLQRCWAHKNRNILNKIKSIDKDKVHADLHAIMNGRNLTTARSAAKRFAKRWVKLYPKAVKCLRDDLDELLSFYRFKDRSWWKMIRTTNAIERRFREVRRRTRPMGVFSDKTSMDRILYAVFSWENKQQGVATPFLLTQNS